MKILLFGATGMIGQGVLRACLAEPGVEIIVVARQRTGIVHERLSEIIQPDVTDLAAHEPALRDRDACWFCLGVSAAGLSEARYTELTYDLTLTVARQLARLNPQMVFTYISGMGTDSSERGRTMWARVKGRTENALLALPFRGAYMFRPGLVQPDPGTPSKTFLYRVLYAVMSPLMPLITRAFPNHVTTTAEIGRAMLAVSRGGYEKRILEVRDIIRLGRDASAA